MDNTKIKNQTLIVIIGPTGIGKTDISINLAKHFSCHIISCDSRQMYKGLNIGTAAPTNQQLAAVNHHFIGNLNITDYYNASRFEEEVLTLLDKLFLTNKVAIMTGGSGLYIDAVVKGIDELPHVDQNIRDQLINLYQTQGITALQNELKIVDPDYYNQADIKNPKRLLKALEVYKITGKPYSTFRINQTKTRPFNIIKIGLQTDRQMLYNRIDKRVDLMIEQGLINEARQFYKHKHLNALNTVGYKELFGHFDGLYTLDEAIRLIKRNSRHYAKRQITWFNRDKTINWFDTDNYLQILHFIDENLEN